MILPINSVINPLLYDSTASRSILKPIRSLVDFSKQFSLKSRTNRSTIDQQVSTSNIDVLPSTSTVKRESTSNRKIKNKIGTVDKIYDGNTNTIVHRHQPHSDTDRIYHQMSARNPYFQYPLLKQNVEVDRTTGSEQKVQKVIEKSRNSWKFNSQAQMAFSLWCWKYRDDGHSS